MENYWVPGVNNHGHYGRWAFAEFGDVFEIQDDFKEKVAQEFGEIINRQSNSSRLDPAAGQEKPA